MGILQMPQPVQIIFTNSILSKNEFHLMCLVLHLVTEKKPSLLVFSFVSLFSFVERKSQPTKKVFLCNFYPRLVLVHFFKILFVCLLFCGLFFRPNAHVHIAKVIINLDFGVAKKVAIFWAKFLLIYKEKSFSQYFLHFLCDMKVLIFYPFHF